MIKSVPIAYITQSFPSLTTTFIYREVLALRKVGFKIVTLAIWKPNVNKLSAESRGLVDSSFYVFPISWPKFSVAHLSFVQAGTSSGDGSGDKTACCDELWRPEVGR